MSFLALGYEYKLENTSNRKYFLIFLLLAYIFTFTLEVTGANFNVPFGSYDYGPNLGPKFLGVPFIIGINWLVVVLGAYKIVDLLKQKSKKNISIFALIIFGALLTVGFDYILEPVAIFLDYWSWEGGVIPLSNYISWGSISLIILASSLLISYKPKTKSIVHHLFIAEFIFFLGITLFLIAP